MLINKHVHIGSPTGMFNGKLPVRMLWVNAALLAALAILLFLALSSGSLPLTLNEVGRALSGEGKPGTVIVVTQWRLPRAVIALFAGAGLAISGAIFQSISRNPLGSPDLVGFNTGAYTGVLIVMTLLHGSGYQIASGALMGGVLTALVVYLLTWRNGISGFRLIVIGIAVSAMLSALNTLLIISASLESAMSAALWGVGSLNGMTWLKAQPALLIIPLCILATLAAGKNLTLLEMGDEHAHSLGIHTEYSRLWLIFIGILLVAVTTASCGPVAFIALAAPQIARRLVGRSHLALTSAALTGAFLLLSADLIAQHAFGRIQLPVGAVTTSIGGIYLIYLLIRESRR